MRFSSLLLAAALSTTAVHAHIELLFPPGINSKFDPQTLEKDIDYSMTTPLAGDGSNYPCKGYATPAKIASLNSVATITAGSKFSLNMTGSATHGGGSCQFALSYDDGKSFAVMTSIIGGCPLAGSYTIDIPDKVPGGKKVLFMWTWFNAVGNREAYQNCAVVDVVGSSPSWTAPAVYRANSVPDGSCQTIPGQDFVYPNPGENPQYGGSRTASSPATILSSCSIDQNKSVTFTGKGSGSTSPAPSSSSSKSSPAPSSSPAASSSSSASASASASSTSSQSTAPTSQDSPSTSNTPSITPPSRSRVKSRVRPSPSATSTDAAPITLQPLPTTSTDDDSAYTAAEPTTNLPSPSPNPAGESAGGGTKLKCTSPTTFSLCDSRTCYPMGNVAPGTKCENDAIVMARRTRSVSKRSVAAAGARKSHAQRSTGSHH